MRRFLGFGLLFIIVNVLQIGVVTAILLSMFWPLGLVVLGASVPVVLLVMRNERLFTRLSRQVQDETGDLATSVEEGAHGLRVIKAFGRADHVFARFDERALRLQATSMEKVRVSARFWTFLEVIPNVALILVLGFGALAAGQGRLTLGTLVAFITLMLSLVWPVASLGFLLSMTQESMTAADRIAEVLDTEPDVAGRRSRAGPSRAARCGSRAWGSGSPTASTTSCATSTSTSPRARPWPWWAPPAPARRS